VAEFDNRSSERLIRLCADQPAKNLPVSTKDGVVGVGLLRCRIRLAALWRNPVLRQNSGDQQEGQG
jgi:hypothetical protein